MHAQTCAGTPIRDLSYQPQFSALPLHLWNAIKTHAFFRSRLSKTRAFKSNTTTHGPLLNRTSKKLSSVRKSFCLKRSFRVTTLRLRLWPQLTLASKRAHMSRELSRFINVLPLSLPLLNSRANSRSFGALSLSSYNNNYRVLRAIYTIVSNCWTSLRVLRNR